jgi:hypothetical protein
MLKVCLCYRNTRLVSEGSQDQLLRERKRSTEIRGGVIATRLEVEVGGRNCGEQHVIVRTPT